MSTTNSTVTVTAYEYSNFSGHNSLLVLIRYAGQRSGFCGAKSFYRPCFLPV